MSRPSGNCGHQPLTCGLHVPSGDKPVLLVVMYHTLDEEHSSDQRRWSSIYNRVKLDVDVLFHETVPGLLSCPQNNEAVKKNREITQDI